MIEIDHNLVRVLVELVTVTVLTYLLVRALRPVALRYGLLDRPDGRKDHDLPTPSTGGIAMLVGIYVTIVVFGIVTPLSASYLAAAALVVLIGFIDDRYDVRWWLRVIAQCAAVLVMVYGGVRVDHVIRVFAMKPTGLGALSVPFTMFATVGVINAINMTDGVDGLAGGLVLAALCMLEAAALYSGNFGLAERLVIFAGAVFGFLMMNMRLPWQPRARAFMGNAGSALLGFTIAWVAFGLTQNEHHPVTPILAPWLVATPLIDCVSLILHRIVSGHSPFRADRNHMHHLMLEAGFTPSQLVATLVVINLALGLFAGVALFVGVPQPLLVIAFVCLCVGYFWLTRRRHRAVGAFAALRRFLARLRLQSGVSRVSTPAFKED